MNGNKFLLIENDNLISNEKDLASIFNNFFINITSDLHLKEAPKPQTSNESLDELLTRFSTHPSIKKIKESFPVSDSFNFRPVTTDDVKKEILNLDGSKANIQGDIPADILKASIDIHLNLITEIINDSFKNGIFPDELKLAEVSPIFKKKDSLKKENYRPVSVLSHISKIFERLMYKQIEEFMQDKLSPLLTGFRKNHSTQQCLVNMLEEWKKNLDNNKIVGSIFMDLSKAFDTINHDLLVSKLDGYGFSSTALKYIKSYLENRKQRVNINNSFSLWENIFAGVPQGSILGPLLFNIFLNDIFLFVTNSCLSNYADDNTLYCFGENIEAVNKNLKTDFTVVIEWFYQNYMVLNAEKCHYMCLGRNTENATFRFNQKVYENSKEETILGITIDNKLTFYSHVKEICKKTSQKISDLSRIAAYLSDSQKKLIFNSILKSQFSYCPLVWMFCSRTSNNVINKIHERSLQVALDNNIGTFTELLAKSNDITNHHRNIQILMTEIFKIANNIAPHGQFP